MADSDANAVAGRLRRSIIDLGDVDERRSAALDAMETWLLSSDGPAVSGLQPLLAEVGSLRSELDEVREAVAAVQAAGARLDEAASWLFKAGDWSTYDTFFGGGIVSDAMKYDRVDRAKDAIAVAEESLHTLSAELSDIGMTSIGGVDISSMTTTFDVWFDNIFSDYAVRERISEARGRVDGARRAVADVHATLIDRQDVLSHNISGLTARRDQLLVVEASSR